MVNHLSEFGLQDAWGGQSPEQQLQSAMYVQQNPDEFSMVGGRVVPMAGYQQAQQEHIQQSAHYMASNPTQFGFDPNKSPEENYQAAVYIQSHPEQFHMVKNPDGTYSITQVS